MTVNDTFYLKNFKGVRNIGYHYDKTIGHGISGENLGFDKFLSLNAKAYMINSALLKDILVDPFLHVNASLAPNRNAIDPREAPQTFI